MTTRGLAIAGPYRFLPDLAKQAEQHGFDGVWLSEINQDSIVQSALLGQATERVTIGTNITLAFPRSPTITAMSAWDLQVLTRGRFVIGLGSQVRRIINDRFSMPFESPAKRMAEYVQAMRTVWAQNRGEDASFEGDIWKVTHPGLGRPFETPDEDPEIFVAAVGPLMTAAAATHADGIHGHPFTSIPYLRDDVLPKIEDALEEAGRSRNEFTVSTGIILSISEDRETAIREAKGQIGFYGTTPNYKGVFASYGDEDLTDRLREAWKAEDRYEALIATVPDEAVERYAVAGTPDEVRDQLGEYEELVDNLVLGPAWYQVRMERAAESLWQIMRTFGDAEAA
jgi:probable F420-dependent oxidoreductase